MERNPIVERVANGERGHGAPLPGMLLAAVGAIMLGIGAANDTGWLAITGGIVLAIGIVAISVLHHMLVEYDIYARIDTVEGKKG